MKATGIVRRIDDLGRIVIPKEIRRTLRIREGDPLEIFTDKEGEIILKKYSPIGELAVFAQQYADTLAQAGKVMVLISDRDSVIAAAGMNKKDFVGKGLTKDVESLMESRETLMAQDSEKTFVHIIENDEWTAEVIAPILCEGDVIGTVTIVSKESRVKFTETERKMAVTAAAFLGKQMEG